VADGLDAMAVGVENEGSEIVRVVQRPKARRAVVAAARRQRGAVKGVHRGPVGRAEAHMHARYKRDARLNRDREFHAERSGHRAVIGSTVCAKVDSPHDSERAQGSVVESTAAREIGHTK